MRTKMTIHSIAIRKSGKGVPAIQITAKTEDGKYAKDWLGETAPQEVIDKWTNALGQAPLDAVKGGTGWDLLDIEFLATVVDSDYGLKMEDVCPLDTAEPKIEPKTETKPETDFSDLGTEPTKEVEADELPF